MDSITDLLLNYGYWGMLISAFLAGSILPFSSEAILLGLQAAGLHPVALVVYATIGNVLGSMFNYFIGSLGRIEWIEKYLGVKKDKLDKAQKFLNGRGALMGFFSFIPVIGDPLTIVLGLMKSNVILTLISITIGKGLRYALLAYGVHFFF
jgi:membrane protein YqaA with SNARE-associated domain